MKLKIRTTEEIRNFMTGFTPSHLDGESWVNLKNLKDALTDPNFSDEKLIQMIDEIEQDNTSVKENENS